MEQNNFLTQSLEKPHMCDACQKSFTVVRIFKKHLKNCHLEEKLPTSEQCERSFAQEIHLENHQTIHNEEERHECEEGEKSFTQVDNFNQPLKNSRVIYECKFCQKSFSNKSSHKKHYLTHTIDKPHVCQYCQQTFSQNKYLEKHYLNHMSVRFVSKHFHKKSI